MASLRALVGFPAVVNENAARVVAGGVALLTATALVTGWLWLSAVLALGFALRVAAGPRYSPLGRLAVAVARRLGAARPVPGPPKRFAQTVGLVFSLGAAGCLIAGSPAAAVGLLAVLLVFATLECALGFCAGCWAFARLMSLGLVPAQTCAACADVSQRQPGTATA